MSTLIERFFDEEASPHARARIREEATNRTSGVAYFAFNVLNLRLDFDQGLATVEDELDPEAEESMALLEFMTQLGAGEAETTDLKSHGATQAASGRGAWEIDSSGDVRPAAP